MIGTPPNIIISNVRFEQQHLILKKALDNPSSIEAKYFEKQNIDIDQFQPSSFGLFDFTPVGGIIALPLFVVLSYIDKHGFVREVIARFCWGVFSMSLITLTLNDQALLFRHWISCSPLRFFGKYSYGLYLMHTLVFAFIVPWDDSKGVLYVTFMFTIYIMASLALSITVYHILEKPFLKLKKFFPRPQQK